MALASLALPQLAYAQDECGAATGSTVTCTSAGNPYTNGITYVAPPQDLTIALDPGVVVDTSGTARTGVLAIADATHSLTLAAGTGAAITTSDPATTGVSLATTAGDVTATISSVTTTGTGSDAIHATSLAGGVTVNAATVTAHDGSGIVANGATFATVNQSGGTIATGGDFHGAVLAHATGGPATATIGSATTTGAQSGAVNVFSDTGAASATVGTAITRGYASAGVRVYGATGASATIGSLVRTRGDASDGVDAIGATGPVVVTNNGKIRTAGYNSYGVYALGTGNVTVNGTGQVSTMGDASFAVAAYSSAGPVTIAIGDAVSTTGAASAGLVALSPTDTATITSGAVSTSGADAIAIGAQGASASVTANGDVSRTGALGALSPAAAIGVRGVTGSASANIGNVTATQAGVNAILLDAATTGTVTVRAGGTVSGALDSVNITSGTGATVNNAGTIVSNAGYAIRVTGAPATINNSGAINGRILLTGGNDTVNNSGVFTATLGSDFGAGTDSFVNSGTVRILPLAPAAGTIAFTGLERFANSGMVDLRNGHAGDVLDLGTSSFTGSGNSTLALDVQLGGATPMTDQLRAGAVTGSTMVVLNDLTTGTVSLNPGVVIVQGGAGSSANALALAGGPLTHGFAAYDIAYNPTDFGYRLVGGPSLSAFRLTRALEGTRNLWYKTADAWSAHMTELRDTAWRGGDQDSASSGPASRLWVQMYGSKDTRRNAGQTFSAFGVTTNANLGYQQDVFGGQIGYDFGTVKPGGGLVFGITGGYANSTQHFDGSSDRMNVDDANAGIYASYVSGSFFLNALGKYDHYWIGMHFAGADNQRDLNGYGYGGQAEAGVRLGSKRFFVEPVAQVAYVKTNIDRLAVPGFSFGFDDRDGLRGKAGLRLGSAFDMGGSAGLVYASGMAVHEFDGKDRLTIASGGQNLSYTTGRIGTYGQGTLGFNVTTPGGVTGFVEAFGDYGDDYRGGGGRAGLRLRF